MSEHARGRHTGRRRPVAQQRGAARTGLRDPADMLIVATALHHGAPLVTSDGRIEDSGLVQVIG